VGAGLDELSMAPGAIPAVKEKIRSSHYSRLKEIAEKVLVFDTHAKVYDYLLNELK